MGKIFALLGAIMVVAFLSGLTVDQLGTLIGNAFHSILIFLSKLASGLTK